MLSRQHHSSLKAHILDVEEEQHAEQILFRGKCIRGTKLSAPPCRIELVFDWARKLKSGRCSCRAGIDAQCKHSAALFHFVNQERAEGRTDREQIWQKPSQRLSQLYPKGESIQELVSGRESPNLTFEEKEEELQALASQLATVGLSSASLYKTITCTDGQDEEEEEEEEVETTVTLSEPVTEMLRNSFKSPVLWGNHELSEKEMEFYENSVSVSAAKREEIFKNTLGQSKNPCWFQERKKRITSSVAHKIWRARSSKTRKDYFFQAPLDLPSLSYGRAAEERAKREFCAKNPQFSLHECGLVVHAQRPWLSASPDGLLEVTDKNEFVLLEVKCPYSCKEKEINVKYVKNGALNPAHEYYTQIQCQLFVCDLESCILYIFSDKDSKTLKIERDDSFL